MAHRNKYLSIVFFILFVFLSTKLWSSCQGDINVCWGYSSYLYTSASSQVSPAMAPLTHIVIFQYKSNTDEAQKTAIAEAFLALRNQCLSPANSTSSPGAPYILNIIAGSNNSSEDPAKGYHVSRTQTVFAIILLNTRSVRRTSACVHRDLRLCAGQRLLRRP